MVGETASIGHTFSFKERLNKFFKESQYDDNKNGIYDESDYNEF